ncbi:MAG: DUF4065 domain-containing protein [Candidatus Kapabacteria bacterium]|nr:DUF4065 domain-containing protein [Candidatus Kapabacteria bacterium]
MAQLQLKQPTALQVANAILRFADEEEEDYFSNLKLQKLLYYLQGYHLAFFNKPLFLEDFKAWKHGPVIPIIYNKYNDYGSNGIPPNLDFDTKKYLSQEQIDLVENVCKEFGQFSSWKLSQMTHEEKPWKITPLNGIISKELLKEYFSSLIKK